MSPFSEEGPVHCDSLVIVRRAEETSRLVRIARAARREPEAAEEESSSCRWREAEAYAELARLGRSTRRIAGACGTNKDTVSRFVRCARRIGTDTPRPPFWEAYAEVTGEGVARVARNTGRLEWYTPPEYVEAARLVLGGIALDPASCELAQQTVRAGRYYTAEQDGLVAAVGRNRLSQPPFCRQPGRALRGEAL
jgi:hypothetical protein